MNADAGSLFALGTRTLCPVSRCPAVTCLVFWSRLMSTGIRVLWCMTSRHVSVFSVWLGRQWIREHASVQVDFGQISEIFYVKVDFGSEVVSRCAHGESAACFWGPVHRHREGPCHQGRPCTQVQGQWRLALHFNLMRA